MGRGTRRGFLLFIIVATIPFYLCGIVFWLISPDKSAPTATPTSLPQSRPSNTPINPFGNITIGAQTVTSLPPTFIPTNTRPVFIPIIPTFVPITPLTPTPTWTPLVQPTATTPPQPTNPPEPTSPPEQVATMPILLPASDTPNP